MLSGEKNREGEEMVQIGTRQLELPVIQGGMGVGISLGGLAGAAAACGAMGCVSAAHPGYQREGFRDHPLETNLAALGEEGRSAEELVELLGIPARRVLSALTMLQIEQAVEEGPGRRFFSRVEVKR